MDSNQTTAPAPAREANVKIKLLRACYINGQIVQPGQTVMVTKEEAAEFCDRSFKGYNPFYGYAPEIGGLMGEDEMGKPLPNPLDRKTIVRATRVAKG